MSTIIYPDEISAALWKRLAHCTLLVLFVISAVALRLAYLTARTDSSNDIYLEMAIWRVGMLLAFQTAPLQWAKFIYKIYRNRTTSVPLYKTMQLLRTPLAIWMGGCMTIALVFWPILGST
ncbi:hypothetical protein [Pseudomonas sp. WHRI 8822A]|uniref:hypothetical protein n=1 Tax=Pseudomonas sp. WHRI 8822A TaxID=3162568 RepID=UPI0032ED0F3A